MTSPGSSTTQMIDASRRSSRQMRQRGPSARLKQTSHSPMRSLTSRMASASALASSGDWRRMWNASRCAVRWPMPGSLPSSVTSRWIGAGLALNASHAGQAQPAQGSAGSAGAAGDAAHLARRQLLGLVDGLVDRGGDHVLQQLDVIGVHRGGIDPDLLDDEVAADLHGDHAAPRRRADLLVLELLLGG